jgi:Polyketide cyclase / dehydrase and lipid transport
VSAPAGERASDAEWAVRVRARICLPLPIERAWQRLLAWEQQPRWIRDADRVRVLTAVREGVGVRVEVRTRVLTVPLFSEILEVVAWDPPHRLVMAHRSLVRGTGGWRLEPAPCGSLFTWSEDLTLPVPLLGELALLAYRPVMRWLMGRSMRELARLLTSEARRPGGGTTDAKGSSDSTPN